METYRHDVIYVYCLLFGRSSVITRGSVFGKGRQCNKIPTTVAGDRGRMDCMELMCSPHGQTCSASIKIQDSKKCFVHKYSCYRPVTCIRISYTN